MEHKGQYVEYQGQLGGLQWVVAGDTELPVSPDRWPGILESLTTPPVSQILSDEIDNPADYGLEQPETTVEVVTRRENPYIIFLGSPTEDGQSRYAQIKGKPDLFTVPATWVQMIEGLATEPLYAESAAPSG